MFNSFSLKDRVQFVKKLAFLLVSGISFIEAVDFINEKEVKKWKKEYVKNVIIRIRSGTSIHKSFTIKPFLLDKRCLKVIESGEAAGSLSKNCLLLSEALENQLINNNRIIGALLYPACILMFSLMLIVGLVFFIFPKILPLLESSGIELPLITRVLLSLVSLLKVYGVMFLSSISFLMLVGFLIYAHVKEIRVLVWKSILRIPFISYVIKISKNSNIAQSLSLYLESGFSLLEALSLVSDQEDNLLFKSSLLNVSEWIKKGERFSKALARHSYLFPYEIIQFASMGEESGRLSKTLLHISHLYQQEMKELQQRIFSLIEPAMMIVLGGIVGFVALSLITPIYSITSSLSASSL